MVKKMLLSLALVAALATFSVAQRVSPSAVKSGSARGEGQAVQHSKTMQPNAAPSYCKPCLSYGGDLDPNDPSSNGWADEKDLIITGGSEMWTPIVVKAGQTATMTGMFGNFLTTIDNTIDPVATPWGIRAHVSEGSGGVLGPHGTVNATVTPTGRTAFGLVEYTILGKFSQGVTLKGFDTGATYYINIQPQCTNSSNNSCLSGQRFFLSTSLGDRPNHGGLSTPNDHTFWNSSYFGYTYTNIKNFCNNLGYPGCDNWSQGTLGTLK